MLETREVWRTNVEEEMLRVKHCLNRFPMIAFDTEFPGIIYQTPQHASDDERYRIMKNNVEVTKLIQFGFTLFNEQGDIGGIWEVNFSNFGEPFDTRNDYSIDFLAKHGLDFKRIREQGIDMFEYGFFPKFFSMLSCQENIQWISFHGNYDVAYVINNLSKGLNKGLPDTCSGFADAVGSIFGVVYDLKVIAGAYQWLGDGLGLEKLARKLKIQRIGRAHHTGSDSLLTAFVFIRINQLCIDAKKISGFLYGMSRRVVPTRFFTANSAATTIHYASLYPHVSINPIYDPHMFYNYLIYKSISAANLCYNALPYMAHTTNACSENSCNVVDWMIGVPHDQ